MSDLGTPVDHEYEMNPETEYVLKSSELRRGMVVLVKSSFAKWDLKSLEALGDRDREEMMTLNRWCRVEYPVRDNLRGVYSFTGVYDNATERRRSYPFAQEWLVKKNPILTSEDKYSRVLELVHDAMVHQAIGAQTNAPTNEYAKMIARRIIDIFE